MGMAINENNFEPGMGGNAGSSNTQPGYGTFSSPAVSQNPGQFATNGGNLHKAPSIDTVAQSGSAELSRDVNKLFTKKDVPTIDDVVAGVDWELSQMIFKDKRKAKETVIANLKKNPHFYSDLDQLDINMDKTPQEIEKDRQLAERKKIFADIVTDAPKKIETKPEIAGIMRQMWEDKQKKRFNA
jgi:hypothetical protein